MLLRFLFIPLFIMTLFTSCESKKTIVNGLEEKEANEIWVYLSNKGIDVSKVQNAEAGGGGGGKKAVLWDIQVPADRAADALSLLNQAGLPRKRGERLLGLFQDVGLVPSEMTEKIRFQAGLGEQIASIIRKIDGVLDADVQISFPEDDPLNIGKGPKQPITSSVYVKHTGVLDDPNSQLIPKIKRLVSSSVTGLEYDNVNVTGDKARYTDFNLGSVVKSDEMKSYVSVWTLIIAKESLTRFRILFFTLITLLLLLTVAFSLLLWKTMPFIQTSGGIKPFLASMFPKRNLKTLEEAPPVKEEEKKQEEKKEEDEEGVT
jgi:type III secretion protein J